jgi:uncharacterized protein (TIGR03067 family)
MPANKSAHVVTAPRPHADLEHLQGAWESVAGRRQARLLVAGGRFTFEFRDGDFFMGTFALDGDAYPKRMDMHIEEGPAEYKGRVALCIYHVEGGVLRWCPTRPGGGQRLTSFPGVDDDRFHSLVFRHARPRRF